MHASHTVAPFTNCLDSVDAVVNSITLVAIQFILSSIFFSLYLFICGPFSQLIFSHMFIEYSNIRGNSNLNNYVPE